MLNTLFTEILPPQPKPDKSGVGARTAAAAATGSPARAPAVQARQVMIHHPAGGYQGGVAAGPVVAAGVQPTRHEMFRANVSQLMEIQACFQGGVPTVSTTAGGEQGDAPQLDDEFHFMTDQRHIRHIAMVSRPVYGPGFRGQPGKNFGLSARNSLINECLWILFEHRITDTMVSHLSSYVSTMPKWPLSAAEGSWQRLGQSSSLSTPQRPSLRPLW